MDFLALIGNDRKYNFHSHTQYCDGRAAMEAFAAAGCGGRIHSLRIFAAFADTV